MIAEYRYNAERDRIDRFAYNPAFFRVEYDGEDGKREAMYWACSNHPGHLATIAEKGKAYEDEKITKIRTVLRDNFAAWLVGGPSLSISNREVPGEFVTRYLIAEVSDVERRGAYSVDVQRGTEGDFSTFRELIAKRDSALMEGILASYEACQPERDSVRVVGISQEYSPTNAYSRERLDAAIARETEPECDIEM